MLEKVKKEEVSPETIELLSEDKVKDNENSNLGNCSDGKCEI